MEISRVTRKRQHARYKFSRIVSLSFKTGIMILLLLSWHIDNNLVFQVVVINLFLGMVFINHLNIRKLLPGLTSPETFKRACAIIFYLILVLTLLSSNV